MEGYHSSVLLKETIEALIPTRLKQDGLVSAGKDVWYLDCTLGDGGHCLEIIRRGGKVIGIDVDPKALERAQNRFKDLGISEDKFKLIQGNFRDLKNLLDKQTDAEGLKVAGAIFDLGVSSLQLEDPERGFSIFRQGVLDMRMDPDLEVQALDLINVLTRKELYELFHNLGEEKYSKRLANALVSARQIKPIKATTELAEIIEREIGRKKGEIHPATRVFQALRIAVNDELNALKEGLDQVKDLVAKGRICVISFHSLEDRIVKNTFKKWEQDYLGKIETKKPVGPTDEEINENPRSRSAKMRVFNRL